jgi:hypothetical protein
MRTLLRALAILVVGLLLLPYGLTPLYFIGHPVSTPMLWRWARGERVERIWAPIEAISPALPLAVLIAEDARFCQHSGVDWQGVQAAIEDAEDGEIRGASGISQQGGEEPVPVAGAQLCAQGARSAARLLDRFRARQAPHAGDLSQHRRMGAERRVRRGGGRAPRVRPLRARAHVAAGGAARRDPAQSDPPQRRPAPPAAAAAYRALPSALAALARGRSMRTGKEGTVGEPRADGSSPHADFKIQQNRGSASRS